MNFNRRNRLYWWPTTSTITEVVPQRKFAFRVNTNNTIWSYELEPTAGGTHVVESRHAENGVKPVPNMVVNLLFGGVPNFEDELVDGMNASLARIKAAAESTADARSKKNTADARSKNTAEARSKKRQAPSSRSSTPSS